MTIALGSAGIRTCRRVVSEQVGVRNMRMKLVSKQNDSDRGRERPVFLRYF